jgi:hypothetical protein
MDRPHYESLSRRAADLLREAEELLTESNRQSAAISDHRKEVEAGWAKLARVFEVNRRC